MTIEYLYTVSLCSWNCHVMSRLSVGVNESQVQTFNLNETPNLVCPFAGLSR